MSSLSRRNFKNLTISGKKDNLTKPPVALGRQLASPQSSVKPDELEKVAHLGFGSGGSVTKVRHRSTGIVLAAKVMYLEMVPEVRKRVLLELDTLRVARCPSIVKFYGQYIEQTQIVVCMEFMDCGSLDKIYRRPPEPMPLPNDILIAVNHAVVKGLQYLKRLRLTHRDIKPSNILVRRNGDIKLCYFGVSGMLIDSMAETFVGTSTYMSPERIGGQPYSDAGDVWSLGLTLLELAIARFAIRLKAFDDDEADGEDKTNQMQKLKRKDKVYSMFDLVQHIVSEPPPEIPAQCPRDLAPYVQNCLLKDPAQRIPLHELDKTPYFQKGETLDPRIVVEWAAALPTM